MIRHNYVIRQKYDKSLANVNFLFELKESVYYKEYIIFQRPPIVVVLKSSKQMKK